MHDCDRVTSTGCGGHAARSAEARRGFTLWPAAILIAVLAVLAWLGVSCFGSDSPGEAHVFIVPEAVDALEPPGTTSSFSLRAYVTDEDGNLSEPEPGAVTWTATDPGVTITQSAEYPEATFSTATATSTAFTVTATVGGVASSPAHITLSSAATPRNLVAAPFAAGALAAGALTAGGMGGNCTWVVANGLVERGRVADHDGVPPSSACPGEVTVFSSGGGVQQTRGVDWSSPGQTIGTNAGPAPADRILKVRYHVWVTRRPGSNAEPTDAERTAIQADAESFLLVQLNYANALLRANRTGLHINFALSSNVVNAKVPVKMSSCLAGAPTFPPELQMVADDALHVVIVDDVSSGRGMLCDLPYRHVLLVTNSWANIDIVAHEIGHAMGLLADPDYGHTNTLPQFAAHNVMWEGASAARFHFSLGQGYRMNFDPSGLTSSVTPPVSLLASPCPASTSTVTSCPPLAIDFSPRIPYSP